ncbi:MAG: polysaccharide deacetylase family protein [Thermoanaerobaculia bacterium]
MTRRALLFTVAILSLALPTLAARTHVVDTDISAPIVLCYHIVESPQDPRMEISRDVFLQQMRYLALTGYSVISLRDAYDYASGKRTSIPKNSVVITIDDGWRSTYTEVFPEMQKRNFPFTVFIYPQIIGKTALALTWKQVKEMSDAGVDIQSHSLSHPFLTRRRNEALDDDAYNTWVRKELAESKKILEQHTGRTVSFIAYPYGDYDTRLTRAAARAGYEAGLTCEFGRVKAGSNPLRMKRFVIDKRMDFASFRHYLGAGSMSIEDVTPLPNQILESEPQPIIVSAKIPNYKSLDPQSVGMALLSASASVPYSYDPKDGSITLVLRDAVDSLKGQAARALVWATELKSGKRVEASWTFQVPGSATPPVERKVEPAPVQTIIGPEVGSGGGGPAGGAHVRAPR